MTDQGARPKLRRSIEPAGESCQLRVTVPVALRDRLEALSSRYGVALSPVARAAIEAGLRAVTEQLRRAARQERPPAHAAGAK